MASLQRERRFGRSLWTSITDDLSIRTCWLSAFSQVRKRFAYESRRDAEAFGEGASNTGFSAGSTSD
jgi:hypothetical protein